MFTFAGILSLCSSRKLLQSVKERIVRLALAHSDVSFILTDSLRYVGSLLWFVHIEGHDNINDVIGCNGVEDLAISFWESYRQSITW